jgi:hypothetical protein
VTGAALAILPPARVQDCGQVGNADQLCLRALRLSEDCEEDRHVEALFQYARFRHQYRGYEEPAVNTRGGGA